MITTRKRLDPSVFDLPVEKMRAGYYTDAYFNHTRATLLREGRRPNVVMQVFQKRHAYLGGMDEAIAILKLCADDWDTLTVHALYDGDVLSPYETVLTIEGDYLAFAHLETLYLGTLARRTLITTNVVSVLEAANGKPIIFMPARHGRVRRGQDRRLRRLHPGQDPRIRARRRAGRRLRHRVVADPRLERFHRRHRDDGRQAFGEGRPALPAQPAPGARRVRRILW